MDFPEHSHLSLLHETNRIYGKSIEQFTDNWYWKSYLPDIENDRKECIESDEIWVLFWSIEEDDGPGVYSIYGATLDKCLRNAVPLHKAAKEEFQQLIEERNNRIRSRNGNSNIIQTGIPQA